MGLASSGEGERICEACACQMRQRPASGQCLKHHIQLLTCKRVLASLVARMRDASSARGVRDASSAHACRAVEWERRRGRGEAEADRPSRCTHLFGRSVHKIVVHRRKVPVWKKLRLNFQERSQFLLHARLIIGDVADAYASPLPRVRVTAPSRVRGCVCTQEASPPKFPPILLAIWPAQ